MRKTLLALFVFVLFYLFPKQTTFADSSFSTAYNVTYTVNSNAVTRVNIDATLTNLTTNYYASSYSIEVGFTDLKNISAHDSDGSITPTITRTAKGSDITLKFNEQSVGLNNKLQFSVAFDTSQVAENLNSTWNINIPGISNQQDFSVFNSTVIYPSFLGKPTYIKPTLLNKTISTNGNSLLFTKDDMGGSGISIAFGNFQIYNLNLTYHLENNNLFPISTEIALPPSTNYQDVEINNINPKPTNVTMDGDGNWLAQYILTAHQKMDITVLGKIKVYLSPKQDNLDNNSLQTYLKPQTYWESNNPKIISLAQDLKTPYAIYQYVVKTLSYDFSRVESDSPRLGALKALSDPNSAVCLEFTDLFIALSRAAGIPAREIDGYGYTNNTNQRPLSLTEDVLHAWPEYYDFDKQAWIMVDPTWGNTTDGIDYFNALDFDHIAFVVKGLSSTYPVPAGGYKLSKDQKTKDVDVTMGTAFGETADKLTTTVSLPNEIIAGLPIDGQIKLSNLGPSLSGKQAITVSTNSLAPNNQSLVDQDIPPYGFVLVPVSFNKTSLLTNEQDTIKITVGNNTVYKNIKLMPFFINRFFVFGGITIVSFGIILSLTAYLFRRLSLSKQEE